MNFLSFDSFIAIPVIITFYYLGAILLPLLIWLKKERIQKLFGLSQEYLPHLSKRIFFILIALFLLAEILWRVMFEMIISYFQMREYLQHLAG